MTAGSTGPQAAGPPGQAAGPAGQAHTNAGDYLAASRQLLTQVITGARGTWPRACAWLIRLALESELTRFWHVTCPPAVQCRSRRAQFLLLPHYTNPGLARRAHQTWAVLSHAGHHQAYELGLTAAELSQLLDDTAEIIAALRATAPGDSATTATAKPMGVAST